MSRRKSDPSDEVDRLISKIKRLKSDIVATDQTLKHLDDEREALIQEVESYGIEFGDLAQHMNEEFKVLEKLSVDVKRGLKEIGFDGAEIRD